MADGLGWRRCTAPVRRAGCAVAVAAAVLALATPPPVPAAAATLPTDWCAPEPATADRPDVVAGPQIHVVYAYPTDAPDRTTSLAPRIVRDLGGVDAWWQGQDPGRTPRFDLADFPGCDSRLGALDITTVALSGPTADYGSPDASLGAAVRPELSRVFGPKAGTVYLVYLDAPVGAFNGNVICGLAIANLAFMFLQQPPTCSPGGGLGSGNGWPAGTAAHELTHLFTDGNLTGAPHVCPDDDGHICEPDANDLLDTASRISPYLSDVRLDPGRDDYYGHGVAGRVDARASDYLARLDAPQQSVSVAVEPGAGGRVASSVPGIACPPACGIAFDGGTSVRLVATASEGFEFRSWTGACRGASTECTFVADRPTDVTATFERLVPYTVRVDGRGAVTDRVDTCFTRCTWEARAGEEVDLYADPPSGRRFTGWAGDCEGTRRRCHLRIGKHTRVVATFAPR